MMISSSTSSSSCVWFSDYTFAIVNWNQRQLLSRRGWLVVVIIYLLPLLTCFTVSSKIAGKLLKIRKKKQNRSVPRHSSTRLEILNICKHTHATVGGGRDQLFLSTHFRCVGWPLPIELLTRHLSDISGCRVPSGGLIGRRRRLWRGHLLMVAGPTTSWNHVHNSQTSNYLPLLFLVFLVFI